MSIKKVIEVLLFPRYLEDVEKNEEIRTTCELIVLMITDNLIGESVTLTLNNVDAETFLDSLYDRFVDVIHTTLPGLAKKVNPNPIHRIFRDHKSQTF
jgi:hypothetical protein